VCLWFFGLKSGSRYYQQPFPAINNMQFGEDPFISTTTTKKKNQKNIAIRTDLRKLQVLWFS
jgi:hypothetical protein